MTTFACLIALLFAVDPTALHGAELQDVTPRVAGSKSNPAAKPAWVSADAAFDEQGALRRQYFDDYSRERFDRIRKQNADGCRIYTGTPFEHERSVASLDQLIANALTIVSGEVVASRQGFLFGQAGTLYTVRLSDRLKSFGDFRGGKTLHFFIQVARIQTTRGWICSITPLAVIPTPAIGDRVLLFAFGDSLDTENTIAAIDPRTQLVIERSGVLYSPKSVAVHHPRRIDDLLGEIRSHRGLTEVPSRNLR